MFATKHIISVFAFVVSMVLVLGGAGSHMAMAECSNDSEFTMDFRLQDCGSFWSNGANPYFPLVPGYQLVLEGQEADEGEFIDIKVVVSVLREIEVIRLPGFGPVVTRVVEEREWEDDELVEVSRNFFAICKKTGSVFYFGEDVDDYEDGEIVGHEGAWRAGENGAMPGIIMPGTFLLGAKYYQEYASLVAEDRAENSQMGLTVETPAGVFEDCVMIVDTNPIDNVCTTEEGDEKIYAPGVGLIKDETLELVDYGFNIYDLRADD